MKSPFTFRCWHEDCPALVRLQEYVSSVTEPTSPRFVPEEERIATFDMDGTLCSETLPYMSMCVYWAWRALEDSGYHACDRERQVAQRLRECMESHDLDHFDYSEDEVTQWMDASVAGLTMEESRRLAGQWLQTRVRDPKYNLKVGETFYQPMLEVFEYLRQAGFRLYILSASDREFCRAMLCKPLHLLPSQIIGYTVHYKAAHQGDALSVTYNISRGEKVLRTGLQLTANDRFSKVESIINEIGERPLLAFGNSSGDYSMFRYVMDREDGRQGMAFCLLNDDTECDYGDLKRAARIAGQCQEMGAETISMANDWKIIYIQ